MPIFLSFFNAFELNPYGIIDICFSCAPVHFNNVLSGIFAALLKAHLNLKIETLRFYSTVRFAKKASKTGENED